MDLYGQLKLKPVRFEPDVWISRLVIFEQIAPEPVVIRDIPLTRGLNIVWAEEDEDDNRTAEITGHSAGKTMFCRLLRYVLGEKTFSNKANMDLVRKALPNGYVAAEVHVRGRKWAVRRPLGSGRTSYVKQDGTIEDLLKKRGHPASQESYPQDIGLEGLVDEIETGGIIRTGEAIHWGHILAWCTRDQETRFQTIHEWRSPRSESESPAFRSPKAGPLFVMRAVLGLFFPDELTGEKRLADLQREKDRLSKELEDKRREPQFRVNLYDHELREGLKTILLDVTDIDSRPFRSEELFPEDLVRLTARAAEQIEGNIEELGRDQTTLQGKIDDVGALIRQYERELAKLETLFDLSLTASVEIDLVSQREGQRHRLKENIDKHCLLGDILIRECDHVRRRQGILEISQFEDIKAMEQAKTERIVQIKRLEEVRTQTRSSIETLKQERQGELKERDVLLARLREKQNELRDLRRVRHELETWIRKRDQPGGYEVLDALRQKLQDIEREIGGIERELGVLLAHHDEDRAMLASIFSATVRSVLSSGGYDGGVALENRELAFRITHGPAMSGEAVETLAVLLADITCLVYDSLMERSRLPGVLVHDSPREADLGLRIYHSFLRFVAAVQQHFGSPDACPFQYIMTTTTPPPKDLQNKTYVKLVLNASRPDGLLLGRNVARENPQGTPLKLFS